VKVGIGAEKKSKVVSDRDKRITAYHEAGHALLFHFLPDVGPVYSVSIIPTGLGAAGYTMPLPEKDELFHTRGRMLQDITVSLGGRVAEELIFDDVTTGASQDLKSATATAKAMVTKYGFSAKLGLVSYDESDEVFIGRTMGQSRGYSEAVAAQMDEEVKAIIAAAFSRCERLLSDNREKLDAVAAYLLEHETMEREAFLTVMAGPAETAGSTEAPAELPAEMSAETAESAE
jgi:cell division protease FtsH